MSIMQRINLINNSARIGKKNVVYLAENDSGGLFRYQCENIMEITQNSKGWQAIWFVKSELNKLEENLDKIDLVVILRQTAKNKVIPDFINKCHEKNIEVLFLLDDLIFDYKDLSVVWESVGEKNILYWLGYFWGVRRIAKKVDGFIVTNEFLGKKIEQNFGKPYEVIPNSLNKKQVEIADECLEEKVRKKTKVDDVKKRINVEAQFKENEQRAKFKIGYFSGSPTHARDFEMVEPEILRFLNDYEDAELEIVGYMKLSERAKKYEEKGRIKCEPPVDYLELERKIARVDVNIAPLVINDFTNCKSELKFFEAGVVETTTIASPTYAFKKAIKDGENGFLALPGEWYDKLEYLYRHPKENQKIAKKAYEYSLKHYCGEEILKEIEKAYDDFLGK